MIDEYSLIESLFGRKRSESRPCESGTSTITGVATSNSTDGSVRVRIDGDLTGGEDGELVIPTEARILKGDIVNISLVGGTAKSPRATGTVGGGDRIYAELVETEQLVATKADVTDLTAATARITDVEADTAKIHSLTANELSAATGYIGDLTAGNLTAANLISDHQTIGSIDVSQINADHATVTALDTNYAQIDLANIAEGTIKTAMIDDGQITSAKILDGTIANADIANGTIQNAKIKDGTIENAKIKDGTIESAKIKDGTIQNADIANGTIETAKIHDGAITNAKIADATIDSAKITNLTGANGWIDRLMVQTGLIANDGTVFTLDAIKVNAASITAGTIDIERIVVTDSSTGDKHMVTWNSSTSSWDAVKLDGDVLEDRTIAADKIVAHDITVQEITTQNLVGTGGWINLAAGTFQYVNATSGDGISWDGTNLTINAASLMTTISGTYATQTALANEANARKAVFGTSNTGATTQTKTVTCSNFTRYTGAVVTVKFSNANTYNGTPKLNVNSTGAAEIRSYTGAALTQAEREWVAGAAITFSFDGTYWRMLDNGMTGRMSTAESSITQNADKISLVVADGSTSSNLSLTADAMSYIGNNVVITDSTGTSTVISGGKLYTNQITVGSLQDGSSYSTTSQMNTAIGNAVDGIDVGGRNLLKSPAKMFNGAQYQFAQLYLTERLVAGQTYTIQLWGLSFDSASTGLGLYLGGGSNAIRNTANWFPDENGYLAYTFTLTSAQASHSQAANLWLCLYNYPNNRTSPAAYSATLSKWKLEKGNKATDWTPAPEDTASGLVYYATCSTAAATAVKAATTVQGSFTLTEGAMVNVKFSNTNSAAVADLKLDVNGTGEKPIKYIYNNALNNLPGKGYLLANNMYTFRYDGTNWVVQLMYNTNDNTIALYTKYYNSIKAKTALRVSTIIGCGTDGLYYEIQGGSSFDLASPLLWCNKAIDADGTNYSDIYTQIYDRTFATCYDWFTGTANTIVFLVGTVSGNTYTVDSSNFLTCTQPSTSDGKCYIPIGRLGNQSNGKNYFNYMVSVPVQLYAYKDGAFGPVSIREAAEAAKTATNYITEISNDGIWVTPSDAKPSSGAAVATTTGWHISNAIELFRQGVSYIKMWLDSNVPKIRIGIETGNNIVLDDDSIDFYKNGLQAASIEPDHINLGTWSSQSQAGDEGAITFFQTSGGVTVGIGATRDYMRIGSGSITLNSYDGVFITKAMSGGYTDREVAIMPDVLYNSTSGNSGEVTLSSSSANYVHMRIYFYAKGGGSTQVKQYNSADVYEPNGKYVALSAVGPSTSSDTNIQIRSRLAYISANKIKNTRSLSGTFGASSGVYNEVYIYRVEAWKV